MTDTLHDPSIGKEVNETRPEFSIVVPLFNEAESIHQLHARLEEQLINRGSTYEILFIDDGSTDLTFKKLMELHAKDPSHVRIVRLRKNFGQTAGLMAGFDHARGSLFWIVK